MIGQVRYYGVALFALAWAAVAGGQEVQSVAESNAASRAHAVEAAVLGQVVSLHLDHVSVKTALAEIAARGGIRIAYDAELVPVHKVISLVADHIRVGNALASVLEGTGLHAVVPALGRVRLEPGGDVHAALSNMQQQGTATISGSVTDSGTGASIPQVFMRVDGTTLEAKSGSDGAYKITGVPAGEYRVTARRVGYIAKTHTITLTDGQAAKLNFGLNPPATKLDEVVTTATGDQRRYQVGTVIATINVDSIAPTAPVTSVTDIMTGRAPGVQIVENNGMVGGGEAIRIWGTSSMLNQSQPILIVDGIRQDNTEGGLTNVFNSSLPGPSRINDIDLSQIETIQILKGPAATTEYGPDAANGVIVIQTKQGTSGKTQWMVSAEQSANTVPMTFGDLFWNWAHSTDGRATPNVRCPIITGTENYFSSALTAGSCLIDSTTGFNPLDHAATTDLGSGPGSKYDLSVGGGTDVLRYYLSGGLSNLVGGAKVPDVLRSEALGLGFPESFLNPNSENQRSGRLNATVQPFRTMGVQVSIGYMSTFQQAPTSLSVSSNGIPVGDSAYDYGYNSGRADGVTDSYSPIQTLGQISTTNLSNWTSGITARWNPAGWFTGNATLGLESEAFSNEGIVLPQADLGMNNFSGQLTNVEENQSTYTVNLTGSATGTLSSRLRTISTLGAYMSSIRTAGTYASGSGLSSAEFYLNAASDPEISSLASASASAGVYAEQQLAIDDRLFLIGSIGLYSGSNFGDSYTFTAYPKLSFSWLAVVHGGTSFRIRAAYGPSGQQPPYGSNEQIFRAFSTVANQLGGTPATGLEFVGYGNLQLRPERVTDLEGGFDLGLWGNRVQIEGTMYDKYTSDALETVSLGWDLSENGYTVNIGDVDNRGVEGTITAVPVQSRLVAWSMTMLVSFNANKLVRLAPGVQYLDEGLDDNGQAFVPGYSLYGVFGYRYQYHDLNHDGIIEPNEEVVDTGLSYEGATAAPVTGSLSTTIGFMRNIFAVNALFNYAGDYVVPYNNFGGESQAVNALVGSPTWVQAMNVFGGEIRGEHAGDLAANGIALDGTYVRFQELSLTYMLPRSWARAMRLAGIGLTGGIQNLWLWTNYPLGDPQATGSTAQTYNNYSGITTTNADVRFGDHDDVVPLTRHWVVRLNVRF